MRYGLIGCMPMENMYARVYQLFGLDDYEQMTLSEKELERLLAARGFEGISVTDACAGSVIRHADAMDESVYACDSADTLVNRNGRLIAYNAEYAALKEALAVYGISLKDRKAALIGNPDVYRSAAAVLKDCGAAAVYVNSEGGRGCISYAQLNETADEFSVIFSDEAAEDLNRACPRISPESFKNLEAVIDISPVPLRGGLLQQAQKRGVSTVSGTEILVRRAAVSVRFFTGRDVNESEVHDCLHKLLDEKRNIVLIGMPTAGKTTVSALLAEKTGRKVIEMDRLIEKALGTSIRECFETKGEAYFRAAETETARKNSQPEGMIIDCGGGVVTVEETMQWLCANSLVIWLKRDLSKLFSTASRPLSSSAEAIASMYEKRQPLYEKYADYIIDNSGTLEETVNEILAVLNREKPQ